MSELNLDDIDSIFKFLNSSEVGEKEEEFYLCINKLESDINKKLNDNELPKIFTMISRGYDIEYEWINKKYIELLKFNMITKIISNSILEFYRNQE